MLGAALEPALFLPEDFLEISSICYIATVLVVAHMRLQYSQDGEINEAILHVGGCFGFPLRGFRDRHGETGAATLRRRRFY